MIGKAREALVTPVVIIGGGPVGMMVAMNLDRLGVPCLIVNTEPRPSMHPKGSTQNSRTLEHYRRLGLSRVIREKALPGPTHSMDIGYFTRLSGWELARIAMPTMQQAMASADACDVTAQVPEPILRCNQMYVESLVFDHLRTLSNITLRYGWSCIAWSQDGAGVTATIENDESGECETIKASYLIGADGGRSSVRRTLGIKYGGEEPLRQSYLGGTMVSSHLRVPSFYDAVPHPQCWHYFIVNPELRSNLVALNGKDEFLANSQLTTNGDAPDADAIARRFEHSMGRPINVEWRGHWTWTAGQALVADAFASGRVALCGDATHLFTPTGGFGMNTGIDDAANLGWKVAALIQGWGGPGLLATYAAERRPIAIRNTTMARSYTRNVGNVPVGDRIEEPTMEGERARAQTGAFLSGFREEFASIGIQLGARYDGSSIIVSDGAEPPPDTPATYHPTSIPGGRAPHVWIARGDSLFDHVGPGFTMLRIGGAAPSVRAIEIAARERGIPLNVVTVDRIEARDLYGCDLALIRPDQHVAWRGNALPEDSDDLLARVTGW